jgi:hypothetical protein
VKAAVEDQYYEQTKVVILLNIFIINKKEERDKKYESK